MKKFIVIMFILSSLFPQVSAYEGKEIKFIYINGSNNNDKKMKNWFYDGMKKMHPYMKKEFSSSDFVNIHLLEQGKYRISQEPEAFFWGDKSREEISNLNYDLKMTKVFSPRLAQTVRTLIAHYLHDAIWVSHYHNMHPVVEDLHAQVMENYRKGIPVVLFGYSAGAFVSYEYMFNKLPDIDTVDYFNRTAVSDEFKNFVNNNKSKSTCIDALIDSKLAVYSAEGRLIPNLDTKSAEENYLKLDEYTNKACIPQGALKGIVNFASPLVLFYSDISNPNYSLTYYNKLLYKYLLENNMFWLTVNYADDPLGYPTTKNISYKDLRNKIQFEINPAQGFLYSKSNIKSRKTFLGAHTSYWATAKKFSKAVVKAFEDGYCLYNYDECRKNEESL